MKKTKNNSRTWKILAAVIVITLAFNSRAQIFCKGGCTTPCITDNYSVPANWTVEDLSSLNGQISAMYGTMNYTPCEWSSFLNQYRCPNCTTNPILGATNNRVMRSYRSLGMTLSDLRWRAECKINVVTGNSPSHFIMAFTGGTQDPQGIPNTTANFSVCGGGPFFTGYTYTPQDGIFASLISFGNINSDPNNNNYPTSNSDKPFPGNGIGWRIFGHARKGTTGLFWPNAPLSCTSCTSCGYNCLPQLNWSFGIPLPALNTDYWVRLERYTQGWCRISVFSDQAMTVHVPESPQCFQIDPTITGLNTIQHSAHSSGTVYRSLNMTLDELKIYKECPNDMAVVTPTNGCLLPSTVGISCFTAVTNPISTATTPTTYTWLPSGNTGSVYCTTGPPGAIPGSTVGTWTINATLAGGCPATGTFLAAMCNTQAPKGVNSLNESVLEFNSNEYSIFPNPSKGIFSVNSINGTLKGKIIQVFDIRGKLIKEHSSNNSSTEINISEFDRGFYLLRIAGENDTYYRKILKD